MDYNELYHHGIKGQKWGVRRFQNKDGTRTAAGKRREKENLSSMSDQELRDKIKRMNLEKRYHNLSNGRSSSGLDIAEKSVKVGSSAYNIAGNISKAKGKGSSATNVVSKSFDTASKTVTAAKTIKNTTRTKKVDLSSMSDKELRELVNRMDLEQQYSNLKKETVSKGRVSASQVLDVAGSVLTAGASAATLGLTIYKIVDKFKKGIDLWELMP